MLHALGFFCFRGWTLLGAECSSYTCSVVGKALCVRTVGRQSVSPLLDRSATFAGMIKNARDTHGANSGRLLPSLTCFTH